MTDQSKRRGMLMLLPLELVILAIGIRLVATGDKFETIAGWLLVVGAGMVIAGFGYAILRPADREPH